MARTKRKTNPLVQEVETSAPAKKIYRKNFEEGKPIFIYGKWLGYRKGEYGAPEIVPEEAAIVERVFNMYLEGQTVDVISKQLQSENIQIPGKKFSFSKSNNRESAEPLQLRG